MASDTCNCLPLASMGVKAQMLLCVRDTEKISAAFGAKSHATHEPFKVQSESDRTQMALLIYSATGTCTPSLLFFFYCWSVDQF